MGQEMKLGSYDISKHYTQKCGKFVVLGPLFPPYKASQTIGNMNFPLMFHSFPINTTLIVCKQSIRMLLTRKHTYDEFRN